MLFVGSTAYRHGLFQDKIIVQYKLECFQLYGSRKLNLTGFMCHGKRRTVSSRGKYQISKKLEGITNRLKFSNL
jgi:hypothetical protein